MSWICESTSRSESAFVPNEEGIERDEAGEEDGSRGGERGGEGELRDLLSDSACPNPQIMTCMSHQKLKG